MLSSSICSSLIAMDEGDELVREFVMRDTLRGGVFMLCHEPLYLRQREEGKELKVALDICICRSHEELKKCLALHLTFNH